MPSDLLYPYQFGHDALVVEVVKLAVDGDTLEGARHVDRIHRSLSLASISSEWEELILSISVAAPESDFADLLPDGTSADTVHVWLVCRNSYTRIRKSVKLTREGNVFGGILRIAREDVSRTTDLECFAVLGASIAHVNGFASKAHQRIADAPGWKLYTDTIPPMPGGALNSRWLVFEESPRPELAQRNDCVWYLDLSNAEVPELLLNEGVPKLRQTLEVEGKIGKAARVRDALIHSILQGVIGEMSVFVLASNSGTPLEEIPDWERKLLVTLARLEPRATEEVVAESWLEYWSDPAQVSGVLNEVTTAVQRHLNLSHSSQYLADSVEAEVVNA